jgi:hemerythrin-like domain-containing protein
MNDVDNSTLVLRREHHLIERATVAIANIIEELENGSVLDRRKVWELAQSFATYVGRCHHTKEDFLLSMIRTRRGCSADYPVRTFYEEHHRVEVPLANLRKAADEYLEAVDDNSEPILEYLRNVVDFYPGHMWKADRILFPLADELLSQTDHTVLVQHFAWIESIGSSTDEKLRAIVAELHPEQVF